MDELKRLRAENLKLRGFLDNASKMHKKEKAELLRAITLANRKNKSLRTKLGEKIEANKKLRGIK